MRKLWPKFFMDLAHTYADQVTCASGRKVGCVITIDNRVVATGFNGVISKVKHPEICERLIYGIPSGQGLHMCDCVHAEIDAINYAKTQGVDLTGAEMYVTAQPCDLCAPVIIDEKIGSVHYDVPYPGSKSLAEFDSHRIPCEPYHNKVLRELTVMEQAKYLVELSANERGLDRIAKLIPAFSHMSDFFADAFAVSIVNASELFGKQEPIVGWFPEQKEVVVRLAPEAMPIVIAQKPNLIPDLRAHSPQ
mgnify:FL=1